MRKSVKQVLLDQLEKDRSLFADTIFKRPESLSALIPLDEYLSEHGVFVMKDGSLGVAFEVELIEHEVMSGDEICELVSSLESVLSLSERYVLQIHFQQREVSGKSPIWDAFNFDGMAGCELANDLFKTKLEAAKQSSSTLFERKCIFSIRYFPEKPVKKRQKVGVLAPSNKHLLMEVEGFISDLKAFQHVVDDFTEGLRLGVKRLDAEGVVEFCRFVFNPKSSLNYEFPKVKLNESLSNQIVFSEGEKKFSGVDADGVKIRPVTLKGLPGKCWPGMMTSFLQADFPFQISLNITFPPKIELSKKLNTKLFFLSNAPSAKAQRQRDDATQGLERLEYGDQGIHCAIHGLVYGKDDEQLEIRSRKLAHFFHQQFETSAVLEKTVGFGQILCSIPFSYDHLLQEKLQRSFTMYRRDVINFLPVFDSFRGLSDPEQFFVSRESTVVPFSLFSNPTSNHTVVVADSGSGKSAFVNDVILSAKKLDPEPLVFVVDKKTSYMMLNRVFDGDITLFDPNKEMPFSPFRGVYDEAKITFLTNLLISAVALTSPRFEIDSEHLSAISKCLRLAYNNKYQQSGLKFSDGRLLEEDFNNNIYVTVDDVIRELSIMKAQPENESARTQLDELGRRLKPFYGDGPYARYFAIPKSAEQRSDSNFYVYDIEGLTDPVLSELISMSIFEEIRMLISRPENEGRMSIIVAEELGQNGDKNPTAAKYWSDFAETMRKKGAWLIGLAPNPKIFFETKVGQAFWGAADNYVFLKLAPDNVQYLEKCSDLIDENTALILKSLDTKKNEYADIFYTNKNKSVSGVFRFPQTSLDKWLSPTNFTDSIKAKNALKRYKDPLKAINYLIQKYPAQKEGAKLNAPS